MHELAVTESILEIATRHAEQAGATRITQVYLVIGQLSSIIDDSVQFYWEIITKATPAENSQLNFRRIPAEMQCLDCDFHFSPTAESFDCPDCHSANVIVKAGEEFFLEAIDIET